MTTAALDRRSFRAFCKVATGVHAAFVALVTIGAYTGRLPVGLPSFRYADLVGHFFLIGLLAFFLDGALGYRPLARGIPFPRLAPTIVLAFAGLEEILQRLSPRRASSFADYAADAIGVLVLATASRLVDDWLATQAARGPAKALSSSR